MDTLKKKFKRQSRLFNDFNIDENIKIHEIKERDTNSQIVADKILKNDKVINNNCNIKNVKFDDETYTDIDLIEKKDNELLKCILDGCNKNDTENLLILSCGHIYHIKCINNEKCNKCNKFLKIEEKIFINLQINSQLKELYNNNDNKILLMENAIKNMQSDILEYNKYKKTLEHNIGISKNIITNIGVII